MSDYLINCYFACIEKRAMQYLSADDIIRTLDLPFMPHNCGLKGNARGAL